MKKFYTTLLYGILRIYASLPMPVLFLLSDLIFFPVVYHIGRYRRKVVRRNLENSFPDYSPTELKRIERRFYHHFCDNFQETVRVLAMSEKEAAKRMVFVNPEVLTSFAEKGQGVLLVLGHYGNWEYQPFLFTYMLASGNQEGFNVYRPLKNVAFDELMKKIRTHFGGSNVTKNETYRTVVRLRKNGIAGVFGMVSDQSPSRSNLIYWTKFLNQDTSILTGPERMAKQTGFAVVYSDVSKTARGCYQSEFMVISDTPAETAEFEITERYARLMEKTILRDPAFWLWTHKRWKHKRPAVQPNSEPA
ncbi:MAG TPA: lysophospholipid acyltransferase family protein [Bacteroidales bacterium]|nr:lysophospholipid acyltransferase family protein [Bacteroidales bacterium]